MLVKAAANVFAADGFIHTQVINIKSLDIGQDVVSNVLLKNTESISKDGAILVYSGKDRAFVIVNDCF